MLDKINDYYDIPFRGDVDELLARMPVMTTVQFGRSIRHITGYDYSDLSALASRYVNNGIILISDNNLVTTKDAVDIVSKEMPIIEKNGAVRIGSDLIVKDHFEECMDCYNIVLAMLPKSEGFECGKGLVRMYFLDKEEDYLYQIIRIPGGHEQSYSTLLRQEEPLGNMQDVIRRIALVNSDAAADYVPRCGFISVCAIDATKNKGFRVLEHRKEDIWADSKK